MAEKPPPDLYRVSSCLQLPLAIGRNHSCLIVRATSDRDPVYSVGARISAIDKTGNITRGLIENRSDAHFLASSFLPEPALGPLALPLALGSALMTRLSCCCLFLARPTIFFFDRSCFSTLGACLRTLPLRAMDPWTFPILIIPM